VKPNVAACASVLATSAIAAPAVAQVADAAAGRDITLG
jgi:hypothetical protein